MADANVPRARGRARGRPRGAQQQAAPAGRPGQSQQPQQQPPQQAQMLAARGPAQLHGPDGGARGGRGPQTTALDPSGLARRLQQVDISGAGAAGAGAAGAVTDPSGSVGRGTTRGRKPFLVDLVRTKPAHITSKRGVVGTKVMLTANFYKLETHTDWRLYQYRVDFHPETDQTHIRKGLLRTHKEVLGGYIFDGTMMFTSQLLSQDVSQHLELFSKRQDDEPIRITIRLVGHLAVTDYHYLQFFNILMRKCLHRLNLQLVGRNFYDPVAKVDVREFKLELWPGYITSIRQHESSILMCSEITHKVMRKDTVLEMLCECINRDGNYRGFQQAIIGAVVLTDYNNKTYRVDDVDLTVKPSDTFTLSAGKEISYVDYYYEKYQIRITEPEQPMLVSRTKGREQRSGMPALVYLVPELCRLTGLTDQMRGNFQLMRALADHTRVGPNQRIEKLKQFAQRLAKEKAIADDLKQWNMSLSQNLVEFDGRVLPNEAIVQNDKYCPSALADWTKELRSRPMLVSKALTSWVVISPVKFKNDVHSFVSTLQRTAGGMKFNIPSPLYFDLNDDRAGSYIDAIEKVINSKNPDLILIVVPNNRADRYSSIKKKCCVDRAVCTQVILAKNLSSKGVMSIATKVAVQINCKIGGAPWSVEVPLTGLMVVGFDVCHDTSNRSKSYGAMVASLDKPFSRYFSTVTPHSDGEELSKDLSLNLCKAVRKYMEVNNALPSRIIIYRDGVGEGQIPHVYEMEVNLIREKLEKMYAQSGLPLKMAFVIVTKRINARIFLKGDNPPPGTVVDDCITNPERYDFFLVSQTVKQGTVSPTSYNVISDNVGLDPDKLQRLTYKLTHLYYNWSGTVRVPAPCQYAHKLAYLVGQALHRPPATGLEDRLYFL